MKSTLIESKPLNFWERAYLPAIFTGVSQLPMKHFFRKPANYHQLSRRKAVNFRKISVACTRLNAMRMVLANVSMSLWFVRITSCSRGSHHHDSC